MAIGTMLGLAMSTALSAAKKAADSAKSTTPKTTSTVNKSTTQKTTSTNKTFSNNQSPVYQEHIDWFGSPEKYADQIKKTETSGGTLSDPKAAAEFKKAYPQLFSSTTTQKDVIGKPPTEKITQQTNANNWPYYEKLLLDLLNQPSAYAPPSASELKTQAGQFAGLQVDPVLASITDMIQKAMTNYTKAQTETEAAYAGIPARTQAMLGEARNYALENAISRGMGRSGVVNWETEKRTTPIMQWSQEKEGEKAAKLAGLAEELAAAEASANRMRTDTEARRGQLEAQYLAEQEQKNRALEQQAQAQKYQQATGIANMALQDKSIDQTMLMNLLKQFMYG
ncbi:MAG: hypothetical protein PHW65_03910 [Dehalococcoidales bacterium]|nr:hypothetical protein [Dehalococcoidales bacterium]